MCPIGKPSPEYNSWASIVQRCTNPKNPNYSKYGGRGITVCDEWREDFATFLRDMGPRPSLRHSIDRYPDNDGPYAPDNCRWATDSQQMQNTRRTVLMTMNGKTMCLTDWAKAYGIGRIVLHRRLAKGWTLERALTAQVRKMPPRRR
jgi:hypothetical protein